MKLSRLYAVLIMFLLAQGAAAGQWNSLSSGGLQSPNSLDQDFARYIGAGVQYEFDRTTGNWLNFFTASQFLDANQDDAYLAGGGMARRFILGKGKNQLHLDLGMIACAMQRRDFRDGDTFLAAVPTFSLGSKSVAMSLSYLPNPQDQESNILILQLKLAQEKFW